MVNRYIGNTGQVQRIPEPPTRNQPVAERQGGPQPMQKPPPNQTGGGFNGPVQRILNRISPANLEQEDLILLLILYLLYRESGDRQFLITLIAFLVL